MSQVLIGLEHENNHEYTLHPFFNSIIRFNHAALSKLMQLD